MMNWLPPGAILILGGLLLPLVPGRARAAAMFALPVLSFLHLLGLPAETLVQFTFFDYTLSPVRVDRLSFLFGVIFHLAAFLGVIYSLHVADRVQQTAALTYAGSAIAGAFAGDLITLFVFWEFTTVASVFLIWSRRTPQAFRAGMRYLIVQVGSGVLLLAGILLYLRGTGSLDFGHIGLESAGGLPILLAFGIKAAFPFLHNWLQDAYPEATVTGTVFLSAFTTKLAIYALARGFAGTEILIYIGAAMTVFPVFFAVIENDLRRVLAYSLNNQLGFMVCGIGIGTELALNGTVSHAFAHILYKALLFMSMGAILQQVGTVKASELGGLYKSMPWSTTFCIIGALSISAFPLFSGFVTKSMVMTAAGEGHYAITSIALLFASAGVLHHSGIRIPFHGFFGPDRGLKVKEAPVNMLIAMGATAALCIGIGVFPGLLYNILPFPVDYHPYTAPHVITQAQLLFFALLAFAILKRMDLEPHDLPSVIVDFDWVYRKFLPRLWQATVPPLFTLAGRMWSFVDRWLGILLYGTAVDDDTRKPPRPWQTNTVFLMAVLALLIYLIIDYWRTAG